MFFLCVRARTYFGVFFSYCISYDITAVLYTNHINHVLNKNAQARQCIQKDYSRLKQIPTGKQFIQWAEDYLSNVWLISDKSFKTEGYIHWANSINLLLTSSNINKIRNKCHWISYWNLDSRSCIKKVFSGIWTTTL